MTKKISQPYPHTPDGRYFVVRGRLWRHSDPRLSAEACQRLTGQLMAARRQIADIKRTGTGDMASARKAVDRAKIALGERGPVWWDDGAPDYNRHLAKNTPYRAWSSALPTQRSEEEA